MTSVVASLDCVARTAESTGDVDAVAAPKGQDWVTAGKRNRVFKWIDCFNATLSDVPGKSPFVAIKLTKKSSADLDKLPFARKCGCIFNADGFQKSRGGPVSDFGAPPATCP